MRSWAIRSKVIVNHFRTLLLNLPSMPGGVAGEEYIPPSFRPVPVPAVVQKIRAVLFGSTPDRYMLNYRLYQLLPILHETELVEFVLAYDPRITYWPQSRTDYYARAFQPEIVPLGSGSLSLIGTALPEDTVGTIHHEWRIDVLSSSTVGVRNLLPPSNSQVSDFSLTDGVSQPIDLLNSSLQFHFSGQPGDSWIVRLTTRPQRTAADLLSVLESSLSDADDALLFDFPYRDEQLTWRNLWREHPYGFYRLGGLLLGMGRQLHNNLGT